MTLSDLIAKARSWWDNATPDQQKAMLEEQRKSYVRAEVAFGSDADEAAWRKAHEEGDTETLSRLKREEAERLAFYDQRH